MNTTDKASPTDAEYIAAARALHAEEGEIEIDENATVSRGDETRSKRCC